MKTWRALFWIEVDAVDRGDAEKKAKAALKKKVAAKLYSIEEA